MNKMINKKTLAITALGAILLFAIVSPSMVSVDASSHKDDNPNKPDKGGGGPQIPEFVCNGTFGDDMSGGDILWEGNVVVQDGDLCSLFAMYQSIHITGDLKVAAGGELWVYGDYYSPDDDTITIDGSILAEGADEAHIKNVTVGGDVLIKDNVNGFLLADSNITGTVKLNNNLDSYSVVDNAIGGSLALSNNEGGGYAMYHNFSGNAILGDLNCKNNTPDPTADATNTAEGKISGQCEGLAGPA